MVLAPVLGTLLLVFVFYDIFETVFHASGRGGPINRVQNRIVWVTFRAIAKRSPPAVGDRLCAVTGPLLAIITPIVWIVLETLAFALIYLALAPTLSTRTPIASAWETVLYLSASVGGTGPGDVFPTTRAGRAVTGFQALAGFATFSVAITYILSVFREVLRSRSLALEIHLVLEEDRALDTLTPAAARGLMHVLQAHYQYPLLHYYQAGGGQRSLAHHIPRLARRLEGKASAAVLQRAVERYVHEVEEDFVRGAADEGASLAQRADEIARYLLAE